MLKNNYHNKEEGNVLIVGLIMLVLLTLIGIAASQLAQIEIEVAHNDQIYQENIYLAECAALQGAQALHNADLTVTANSPDWVENTKGRLHEAYVTDEGLWKTGQYKENGAVIYAITVGSSIACTGGGGGGGGGGGSNSQMMCGSEGVSSGDSIGIGKGIPTVHSYSLYGKSNQDNGESIIKIGYRKPY
jgi:hypothetical protein